jgi:amino acid adenylation domain-containing protein
MTDKVFAFPASFAQQRLLILDQLYPGSPLYNVATAVRLKGPLDVLALERSINEITARHEALRSTFTVAEGQPVQIVSPVLAMKMPVVYLTDLPNTQREIEARKLSKAEAERPFDLTQDSLVRVSLLRLRAEEHVLLLTMHHIVFDEWSMGVFFHELSVLYAAFSTGRPSPLPDLPLQYADFAVWQRERLRGDMLKEQLSYWERQLKGALDVLQLPTDRPRPAQRTVEGAIYTFVFSRSLTEALKSLSLREGASLFMTLLAAFDTLLHRYTAQNDIVIGTPVANRNRTELEGLIGFFVNTLVLRTDLSGNPTFRELLRRARETTLEAYAHQELPFERLVEELVPERDLSHNPLFQVLFAMESAQRLTALQLPGLTVEPLEAHSGTSKFDLTLFATDAESTLELAFEYDTGLFNPETIEQMAEHFKTLLAGIVNEPNRRISELPLLTSEECRRLLIAWNDTDADYPHDKCIHQLFEEQVERTPDAVAVVFEDEQLTYRELNERSNRLAYRLRRLGVGPEVLVGICVEPTLEMAVGVMAILKAGGAYVPLDPSYPEERLKFMLEDTRAPVLLTQERLLRALPDHEAHVVLLNGEENTEERAENLVAQTGPENLVYVMYTSGSTGRPKGIGLPHRSLVNLLDWECRVLPDGARTLQFASLSFDVSFNEMFLTWNSGGTLFVVPPALRPDVARLADFLRSTIIERLVLPVVILQRLAEDKCYPERLFGSFREVITTGEQLHITPPVVRLFEALENCTLHNHYGPAETQVVTTFSLPDRPEDWPTHPPIGRPISNTRIYLLDERQRPVPLGVLGELYIGGVSLARGYLERPDLTAERFVPDPFSEQPGARMYRTGDLARYLTDGNIEYLGRIDHQVKIRGYRVEPGETEAVLAKHPAIREAAVVACREEPGGMHLVGYVVPEEGAKAIADDLRGFLREKLPEYMVPSAFVVLDTLPLNPNGKLDRRALPAPEGGKLSLQKEYVAPRSAAEEVVSRVLAEVLGVERVGMQDDFFKLGGHSLLATQVISRLREAFRVELPLHSLFEASTVEGLIGKLAQLSGGRTVIEAVARTIKELEQLSDEEATAMLSKLQSEHDARKA